MQNGNFLLCVVNRKTETANFPLFAANRNGKQKFVYCKQKQKTEVCFPSWANNKW
jgi:hypothetical protein